MFCNHQQSTNGERDKNEARSASRTSSHYKQDNEEQLMIFTDGSNDSTEQYPASDRVTASLDSVTHGALNAIKMVVDALPNQSRQVRQGVKKEMEEDAELMLQLQENIQHEQKAETTGIQGQLPFDPVEIERKLSKRLKILEEEQKNIQNSIEAIQGMQESLQLAGAATMPVSLTARREQTIKDGLEYYQRLQQELAQRQTEIQEKYLFQQDWNNRAGSTYANVALASMSTTDHPHPDYHQTSDPGKDDFASQDDLANGSQDLDVGDEEWFEHEQLRLNEGRISSHQQNYERGERYQHDPRSTSTGTSSHDTGYGYPQSTALPLYSHTPREHQPMAPSSYPDDPLDTGTRDDEDFNTEETLIRARGQIAQIQQRLVDWQRDEHDLMQTRNEVLRLDDELQMAGAQLPTSSDSNYMLEVQTGLRMYPQRQQEMQQIQEEIEQMQHQLQEIHNWHNPRNTPP